MKHLIRSVLLCMALAVLLFGCSNAFSQNQPSPSPESTIPSGQEAELPSSGDSAVSDSEASQQSPQASDDRTDSVQHELTETEEWELLSQFWNQACVRNLVNDPCGEDFSQYQQYYWMISSIYLENKAEAAGEEPPRDEVYGLAYFPIDDYVYTLEAMFGEDQDYRSILPEQPGPEEDTLLILDGYSFGYVVADLNPDSFSLQDNIISVDALRLWQEPGYTKELGTIHYQIQVQPENPYCRYRFLSITGDDIDH